MRAGLLAAALAALALAGCRETPPPAPLSAVGLGPAAIEAACVSGGGRMGAIPGSTARVCYRDLGDGGDFCASADDCEGMCLARSRTCAPVSPLFGCHEILTASGQRATRCVD